MTRTMDQVEAIARAGFPRTINGGSWAGGCEALVNNLGGFTPFPTAVAAGNASGPLDGNPDTARRGEMHYYYGAGGDGHISYEYGGGLELMGSSLAARLGESLGYDIAIVDGDLYRREAAVSYRGHTFRHGSQTLDLSGFAGTGAIPFITQGDSTMKFIRSNSPESGDIAMIDTFYVREFTGAEAFSMEANMAVFGGYQNLTPDQYQTLVGEARARMLANQSATWKPSAAELAAIGKAVTIPADVDLTKADVESALRAVFLDAATK